MKQKIILLIIILVLLVIAIFNGRYDSIEEKIIDDTNTGSSINAEMTEDLFIVDEYSEDFYVCVGETETGRMCVLSVVYKPSGLMHADKQRFSKDKLFDVEERTLTIDKKNIKYGFIEDVSDNSIEIDGKQVDLIPFNCQVDKKDKEISFWYYVEQQ